MRNAAGVSEVRAAIWTARAARRTKRRLRADSLDAAIKSPPPVPALPDAAGRAVRAMLRIRRDRCLVRSIVLQKWEAARGRERDLIIGVTAPHADFHAHAWLEGDADEETESYAEVTRVPVASLR